MINNFKTTVSSDNLDNLLLGLNTAADIIISTMGGAGRNVILSGFNATLNERETLNFTKDGISVAKNIKFTSHEANIGATLLINAANKTVEQCGDGTTTTVLFVKTLVNELIKFQRETKTDIDTILTELDKFTIDFKEFAEGSKTNVETLEDVYHVTKTSSKSAPIGRLMKEIYDKTGFEAVISPELSRTNNQTYYQIINGLNFSSGMINSGFANQENNTAVFENCFIWIEDQMVSSVDKYKVSLDEAIRDDKSIVILAPQFSDTFIKTAVSNIARTGLKLCLVESPGYGPSVKMNYDDIMAFTNQGYVDKVVITDHDFTLFNTPDEITLAKRIKKLQTLADNAIEEYDEKDYLSRIQRLNQSGAIIYVGGATSKNAKEEYDRIEDCIGAISSAIKGGYIKGAGSQLALFVPLVNNYTIKEPLEKVLMSQVTQIMSNANLVGRTIKYDIPFNVTSKQYDETIIDPVNVLVAAMTNAIALTKLLLNTSYILHNE